MVIQNNQSQFIGTIKAIRPSDDGWGSEVQVEILRNELAGVSTDFILPEAGQVLGLFLPPRPNSEKLVAGNTMKMEARLLGGPTGQRMVLVAAEPYCHIATVNEHH